MKARSTFLARLDDAIAEGKQCTRDLSPGDEKKGRDLKLLERASEYLFDIFDANCMEEYHILNNFEERALRSFPDHESEEISFEQERLHGEFLGIFENLLEKFILNDESGVSIADFYDQVKRQYHGQSPARAMEVVDVIFNYTDIAQWHEMMRDSALQRLKYAKQRTALQEAADRALNSESKKNTGKHRLDP